MDEGGTNHDSNNDSDDKESETNHSGEMSSTARKKARTNSSADDPHHHQPHHHHHHHSHNQQQHHHNQSNNHHNRALDHDEASSDLEQQPVITKKTPAKSGKVSAKEQQAANNNSNKKEKKIILSEKIFNECKSILRPVKNALKNIDPPGGLSEREHIERIKRHILEIGDKINDHLTAYSDPEKIKEWRNYLWVFVAKFTSTWSWQRIKDLYKKFAMSRDDELLYGNKPPLSLLSATPQNMNLASSSSASKSMSGPGQHRGPHNFNSPYAGRSLDPRDRRENSSNYHKYNNKK